MPDRKESPSAELPNERPAPLQSAQTGAFRPLNHDLVLQDRINERIRMSPEVDATEVSVVVRNRSATLFGSVHTESQRVLVGSLAVGISGILEVSNRLRVLPSTH